MADRCNPPTWFPNTDSDGGVEATRGSDTIKTLGPVDLLRRVDLKPICPGMLLS